MNSQLVVFRGALIRAAISQLKRFSSSVAYLQKEARDLGVTVFNSILSRGAGQLGYL